MIASYPTLAEAAFLRLSKLAGRVCGITHIPVKGTMVEPLPKMLRKRHVLTSKDRSRGYVRIALEIRRRVESRRINLMHEDFGVRGTFDVIFCGNVIIYFDRMSQAKLIRRFLRCSRPGDYLFTGHSESLHSFGPGLRQVDPSVYKQAEGESRFRIGGGRQ